MALPFAFASVTSATGQNLDDDFNAVGNMGTFPCSVSGTDAITMTPTAGITPSISALADYMRFSGVVATTNTTAVTIQIGSLGALNGYKDSVSGPVALTGGELVGGNAFTAVYDSALNTGAGGFHIVFGTAFAGGTIAGNAVLSGGYFAAQGGSLGATLTSTLLTGNSLTVSALHVNSTNASVTVASVTSLSVGASASPLLRMISGLSTLAFSITSANAVQDQIIVLPGAQIHDSISLGVGTSVPSGAGFSGFMSATGTVTMRLINPTAATLGAATLTVRATALGFT